MKKSYKLSKKELENQDYSSDNKIFSMYKDNKKLIKEALKVKKEYNLTTEDFIKTIKQNIPIPVSIFRNSSPLESLVKYLKDNLELSLHEIASLLNRDQRTIWITYSNVIKKNLTLDVSSKTKVPIEIFDDRKLSIFENLILYLVNEFGFSLAEISRLLNRDYKTIWTSYSRSKKKELS